MVGKIKKYILCLFACFVLMLATTQTANAYTIYDGSISTSILTYFQDIAQKIKINENYVFFRGGQYDYYLVVSDSLTLENNHFTSLNASIYNINTNSNYNSNYKFSFLEVESFDLVVGNQLLYSDLGYYPSLIERGFYFEFATIFIIFVVGLCCLVRPMFSFVQRKR